MKACSASHASACHWKIFVEYRWMNTVFQQANEHKTSTTGKGVHSGHPCRFLFSLKRMVHYELRDPIHKRIPFDTFERSIIDHPFFQRLRFIKQVSFILSYVYPGGTHDRFSHCLGAMHIAGRLFEHFIKDSEVLRSRLSDEEIQGLQRRIRIAGLLHDIGHGPFSHSSETIFPQLKELPLNWDWWKERPDRQARHEDYSVLLIQTLGDEGVIGKDFAQDIASLTHSSLKPSSFFEQLERKAPTIQKILKGIISGEVDCDRMDYLLRDSYYCGVAYGNYDLDWLISSMGIAELDGKLIFIISENGMRAFEDLLLARYHMHDQVYFHKTKNGFAHYLEQAFRSGEIDVEIPTDPYEYADLREGKIIELLFDAAKNEKNYWSHHLIHRIPPKRIVRLHEAKEEDMKTLKELETLCQDNNIPYFTHFVGNELSHFGEGTIATDGMYVAKKTPSGLDYIPVFQYSDLLKKYNEKLRFVDFFVPREQYDRFMGIV